jgi:hypothetical protein
MTPHKQLFRHRPEEGQVGDCWRTAIGCLLDKAPHEVPHFVEDCWNNTPVANAKARTWLATQGLAFVESAYQGTLEGVMAGVAANCPDVHYLLGGNSRTGVGHSVIACNEQIVWDPSIDEAGIVAPMDDGYYWITFLVPYFLVKQ